MCPAIKRPVRSAALDIGFEILAHGCGAQERVHCALDNLAVVIVGPLEQDDHVLLHRVIANPLYEAATLNGGTLEGVERHGAAIFDGYGLRGCGTSKNCAQGGHWKDARKHEITYHDR